MEVAAKEVTKFWDKEVEIGTPAVASTGKSAIKTKLVAKDGDSFVDLRKFVNVKGKTIGFGQFTSSGIAIPVGQLDAVIQVLIIAKAEINRVAEAPKKRHSHPAKKAV